LNEADIASRMESLGRNCEFGFVQRSLGLEPISLLRWAGGPMQGVIDGLRNGFAGLGDEMTGRPDPPNREPQHQQWWLTCRRYDILFHSGQNVAKNTLDQAAANIHQRLRWLAEKLFTDLRSAEKLFVYSSAEFTDPGDGLPLVHAVREIGPAALLLVAAGSERTVSYMGNDVWGASMPVLTKMGQANSADRPQWHRILKEARPRIKILRI
jgi:hypothetical protein